MVPIHDSKLQVQLSLTLVLFHCGKLLYTGHAYHSQLFHLLHLDARTLPCLAVVGCTSARLANGPECISFVMNEHGPMALVATADLFTPNNGR